MSTSNLGLTSTTPLFLHLLSHGTLLGTTVFNTFFVGIISYQILPRPQFASLQTKLFPWFFGLQTLLPLTTALTFPPGVSNLSYNRNELAQLTAIFALGTLNFVVLGPWTTGVMRRRKHQETRDGKRYYEAGPQSDGMKSLNLQFNVLHSVSSLANILDLGVMVWYGWTLATRLTMV